MRESERRKQREGVERGRGKGQERGEGEKGKRERKREREREKDTVIFEAKCTNIITPLLTIHYISLLPFP